MAITAVGVESRFDKSGALATLLTSTILIVFTLAVGVLCVIVLSCTLTQTRMSTMSVDGVTVSIWKLDSIGRQWADIRAQLADLSDQLTKAQRTRFDVSKTATISQQTYLARKNDFEQQLAEFYHRIRGTDPQIAERIHNKGYSDQMGTIRGAQAQLQSDRPELKGAIEGLNKAYEALDQAELARDTDQIKAKALGQQIQDLTQAINEGNKALNAVFELLKPSIDKESRARIENALYELYYDTGFNSVVIRRLITTQADILTLSLVILMGILGSALQMTHAYFMRDQVESIGGYFLRLSVGAITALVIFIVAKAGVPVIADASRLGGDAPINPYLVSFLAIVSGLLSENAIASVQAQGTRVFGAGIDGPNRWVINDLTPDLQAQQLKPSDLANLLGVSEATAAAMIKGEEQIPPAAQRTIAIFLRRNPRDIFTDIPPPGKAQTANAKT